MTASTLVPIIVGIIFLLLALRLLLSGGMLKAIVRALLGLSFLAASAMFFLGGYDLLTYKRLLVEQPVATLQFVKLAPQSYRVLLVQVDGEEHHLQLLGDQWQLDARTLRWHPSLASVGFKPQYRLERISGRYVDVFEQRHSEQSIYSLQTGPHGFDTWHVFRQIPWLSQWVNAQQGAATYQPMADGAVYKVTLAYGGLFARPANSEAKQAVSGWR
jgi:hypothetical protein